MCEPSKTRQVVVGKLISTVNSKYLKLFQDIFPTVKCKPTSKQASRGRVSCNEGESVVGNLSDSQQAKIVFRLHNSLV